MSSHRKTNPQFIDRQLFYLEQWAALILGVVCLGEAAWAGYLAHPAFTTAQRPLAIGVALVGVALLRFAVYERRKEKTTPRSSLSENRSVDALLKQTARTPKLDPIKGRS